MPRRPNPSVTPPNPLSSSLLKGLTPSGKAIYRLSFGDELINDVVVLGERITGVARGAYHNIKSGVTSIFSIFSDPVVVGEFISDKNGDVTFDFTIPNTLEPGIHTLHVFTKDEDDNDLDIYKTIIVAASENDWDGDGVNNDEDLCVFVDINPTNSDDESLNNDCGTHRNNYTNHLSFPTSRTTTISSMSTGDNPVVEILSNSYNIVTGNAVNKPSTQNNNSVGKWWLLTSSAILIVFVVRIFLRNTQKQMR